jgi:predicted small lipoprotein YifL
MARLSMHCWARYLFIAIVSALGIGRMISACGQKGDLYLPEREQAVSPKTMKEAEAEPQVGTGAAAEAKVGASTASEAGLAGQN